MLGICRSAGTGARLEPRIGGKAGRVCGEPIDLEVTIAAIADDLNQTGLGAVRQRGHCPHRLRIDVAMVSQRSGLSAGRFYRFTGAWHRHGETTDRSREADKPFHFLCRVRADHRRGFLRRRSHWDAQAIPCRNFNRLYWRQVADPFARA
ncbi:MAG: hypothetical protein J2P48_02600 [Alphaproteobacteria bacterium]|nr:hypothetical protein [Alphaproteobacteria bacterium]